VEAAQTRGLTDLRREITQALGELVFPLERAGELSESSIQKLQVAFGVATRDSAERRILNELALLRTDLQRLTEEPAGTQKGIALPIAALSLILLVIGVVIGSLTAPVIVPWLRWALSLFS